MAKHIKRILSGYSRYWNLLIFGAILIISAQYLVTQIVPNHTITTVQNQISDKNNLPTPSSPIISGSFNSTWNTSITDSGSSNSTAITLPLVSSGNYNFIVQWGDGSNSTITSYSSANVTHNYNSPGVYNITIIGELIGWQFNNGGDCQKLLEISQWGSLNMGTGELGSYFMGCSNLVLTATDEPDLTGTTDLNEAFMNCSNLGDHGNMNGWNVSKVTNMDNMFFGATTFNQPIGNWNVSSVTDMYQMFVDDSAFNQPIGNWNVSNVTRMSCMFLGDSVFNQSIGNWNVSKVTDMSNMFSGDSAFNQPIGNWNVSNVVAMTAMFSGDSAFNQPIGNWNVSKVTRTDEMFENANAFNQPIESWNVSGVTRMTGMFDNATSFNQPIGNWDVSNVVFMNEMFENATSFNQPISNWNVDNVRLMSYMFAGASILIPGIIPTPMVGSINNLNKPVETTVFDKSISNWNVAKVLDMSFMFYGDTSFNQSVDSWNVSNVNTMRAMFYGASDFNQNIGNWNVSQVKDMSGMFYNALAFNQNIGNWNVSKVENMSYTFDGASSFNQNIGSWNVSSVVNMENMFMDANAFSSENYGALLIGWSNLHLQSDITFSAGSTQYPKNAVTARQYIITTYNWTITDGGPQTFKPSEPTNLIATAETNYIYLTWNAPANYYGSSNIYYDIYRSNSTSGQFILIGNSTTTSYNDSNVVAGQTYYYEISAVNSTGASGFSNVANATISSSSIHKSINGMGISEILSLSFVGVLIVAITIKKRFK